MTDILHEDGGSAMDVVEQRIREVVATLLSSGAKALERTASELERAATGLRPENDERSDVEDVWSERTGAPETITRGAPLRAVPDTPTDEAPEGAREDEAADAPWSPPAEPPPTPERERPSDVDAAVTTSTTVAGPPEEDISAGAERMRQMATGTVAEVRAQLGDLSADELRELRKAELANRNRTTLIASIDRAIADAE